MTTIDVPARNRAVKALLVRTYGVGVSVKAGRGTAYHWIEVEFLRKPDELRHVHGFKCTEVITKLIRDNGIHVSTYTGDGDYDAAGAVMSTPIEAFALRISERARYDELKVQRAFGADWTEAYTAAWRVMDEVYDLVLAPERPAVYLPCRMVSRANAGAPI